METCNRGINIEHKQIPKKYLTDDENYHGTQYIKRLFFCCFFGICLCLHLILKKSVSKSLKFGLKWQFLYLKPILSAILVTIATGKSKINARILHFGYSSNKPIR